jgi:hypothetical protein
MPSDWAVRTPKMRASYSTTLLVALKLSQTVTEPPRGGAHRQDQLERFSMK